MFLKDLLPSLAQAFTDCETFSDAAEEAMELFADGLATFATFLTLALALLGVAVGVAVWVVRRDRFAAYARGACLFGVGYGGAMGALLFYGQLQLMVAKGNVIDLIFYPVLAALIALIVAAVVGYLLALKKPEALRVYKWVALGVGVAAILTVLIPLCFYFRDEIAAGGYYQVDNLGLILSCVALVAVLVLLPLLVGKKRESSSRDIAYAAVCIALSFALSYMRLFRLPQGGSVTLASLVPLMFYSYKFGVRKGVTAGVLYGVLQAIQDPYIIHPAQILLDYPLAFGAIGLSGLFAERKVFKSAHLNFLLGALLGVALRYLCHVLSGVFAFSVYADGTGMSPWVYSLTYNSFALADMAIAMAAGAVMLSSKSFRHLLES